MKTTAIGKMGIWLAVAAVMVAAGAGAGAKPQVRMRVDMDNSHILYGRDHRAYVRVGLTGIPIERPELRAAVNVAIVIDKSGSMSGEKIRRAREAAIMAVRRLDERDTVSVVTYDTTVEVVVPAMRVGDTDYIVSQIRRIEAGGNTALFGGVSKGANEVRKYLSPNRVNRVVLISDGLANVGPRSPEELGQLGDSLVREGIAVTTIGLGLGYNEDLMYQLAVRSDGNHYFAEEPQELAAAFDREFGQTLSVVAQEVRVEIEILSPFRPIRILGRDGRIHGQTVEVYLNQVYGDSEKFVLVEVEGNIPSKVGRAVGPDAAGERRVADVRVRYENLRTREKDSLSGSVSVNVTDSPALIEKHRNAMVGAEVVKVIGAERNELAMEMRDKGRTDEARRMLKENDAFLRSNAAALNDKALYKYADQQREAEQNLDGASWGVQRKQMKVQQLEMQRNSLSDEKKESGR